MLEAAKNQPQYSVLTSPCTQQLSLLIHKLMYNFKLICSTRNALEIKIKVLFPFYSNYIRRSIIGSLGFQGDCG